ncbi:hypothetical protein [Sphingorhabdus sp.]|jgi:hypothetical protein|uniref:hypothetical protein n=1 Tax=Sphingorhabdus sp. TaxID=1902408 RepID=UPI003BAEA699
MKLGWVALGALTLSACGETGGGKTVRPQSAPIPIDKPAPAAPVARPVVSAKGLEAVIGKDMATLTRMFGQPRLDVVEVYGRKLQFAGKPCVLDAYLYPDGKNGAEIVTHVDARRSDGAEVDRVQCVNALMQR